MQRYIERGVIEIAPLAYMRGRTLNRAFVVLDEAQNTTTEQMFMFLPASATESKAVITGDHTQIDLPSNKRSGLVEAMQALRTSKGSTSVTSASATSSATNSSRQSCAPTAVIAAPGTGDESGRAAASRNWRAAREFQSLHSHRLTSLPTPRIVRGSRFQALPRHATLPHP